MPRHLVVAVAVAAVCVMAASAPVAAHSWVIEWRTPSFSFTYGQGGWDSCLFVAAPRPVVIYGWLYPAPRYTYWPTWGWPGAGAPPLPTYTPWTFSPWDAWGWQSLPAIQPNALGFARVQEVIKDPEGRKD